MALAYRFSKNREVTRQFLQKLPNDEDAMVGEAAKQALQLGFIQADLDRLCSAESFSLALAADIAALDDERRDAAQNQLRGASLRRS